jgi:hypothetical protein
MATEQTITISGTPTVVSGVTVPYANTSDLEIYVGQGKVEKVVLNNAGAGYADATNAALEFSGGGGSSAALTVDVANGQVSLDNAGVPTNKGSGYTTAPIVGFGNISGGTAADATAEIYVKKTSGTDYSIAGSSGSAELTFTSALSNGDKVLIKRVTGVSTAANTFAAGTAITADALNKSFDQIRYKVEELPNVTSTALTNGDKGEITVSGDTWTIDNGAVVEAKIGTSAVTVDKIGPDAVNGTKIADNAINSEHYTDGSIDTVHIADDQVTYAKMQHTSTANRVIGAVSTGTLSEVQVATDMVADNAITAPKTDLSIVQGDIVYGTGTNAWDRLAKGTAGQQIRINNGATAPEWFTSNIQSNVYVKQYGIASGGITTPAAGATVSGNLTVDTYYDTPITVTITPQVSSSLILLNTHTMYEGSVHDYLIRFRIKAEVLNNSDVVQSTSYLTGNYTGSAIHNSGSTANGVASSGYENKGANLNKGIEGSNRIPVLIPGNTSFSDNQGVTPTSLSIQGLLHNPGSIVTPNKIKYTVQLTTASAGVVYINRGVTDADDTNAVRGVSWFTAQETMGNITVDI